MFSQMFFTAEPDGDKSGRLGKYASSASSAVGKGVEKARPMLSKIGSALLTGAKKLAELGMKGLKSSIAAARGRFSKQTDTEVPAAAPADEEPKDGS